MTSFTISDNYLDQIKDQVVVVTGASSGIGLATLRLVLAHGGKVYASDLNPLPSPEAASVPFLEVDTLHVIKSSLTIPQRFKAAEEQYGKIDHVFANAGIAPTTSLLEDDLDEDGNLAPPNLKTLDVNLTGCLYTVKLGIHYLRKNPTGGSIVITASVSSFMRFPPVDYTTSKHAVLGLMRSLTQHLHPTLPLRINAIAPSWTATGIVPPDAVAAIGEAEFQSPDVPARSVVLLMTDGKRHGEMVFSEKGRFLECENGEAGYLGFAENMLGMGKEDVV
ncbi:hypothetical protein G6514_008334 [Epicoccum nigrum]|nr:hypothetical protein G6514_008334 [Epicoccum nigrum]